MDPSLEWFAGELKWFALIRGPLFAFNTALAVIPVLLAYALFRPGARRHLGWWAGVAAWLLFLPNAAYVLTDVVHLRSDMASVPSDLSIYSIYVPGYVAFFAAGFTCYVLALRRFEQFYRAVWGRGLWVVLPVIHLAVAIGIFIGRFARVNSWNVVTRPGDVYDAVAGIGGTFALAVIATTFIVITMGSVVWRPVVDTGVRLVRTATPRVAALAIRAAGGDPLGSA